MISNHRLVAALVASAAAVTPLVTAVRTAAAACNSWQCGGNTPILWGTFIRGLSTKGEVNNERVVLRPEPIAPAGSRCGGAGIALAVEGGELRAVSRDGAVVCAGPELVGTAFDLDVPYKALMVRVRVQVTAIDQVSTWEREKAQVLPTYRFEVIADGASVPEGSPPPDGMRAFGAITPRPLCQESAAWMEDWQTDGLQALQPNPAVGFIQYLNPEGTPGQQWREATDHALLVEGESYDEVGSSAKVGRQWFQIACAGSAIAKMRLLGIDPKREGYVDKGVTVSTLKMLGARYGGTTAFTRPGTPIQWERWDHRAFYGGPGRGITIGPLEAAWRGRGAMCVAHLRLGRASAGWPSWFESFVRLALARAYNLGPCGSVDRAVWVTTTADHLRD